MKFGWKRKVYVVDAIRILNHEPKEKSFDYPNFVICSSHLRSCGIWCWLIHRNFFHLISQANDLLSRKIFATCKHISLKVTENFRKVDVKICYWNFRSDVIKLKVTIPLDSTRLSAPKIPHSYNLWHNFIMLKLLKVLRRECIVQFITMRCCVEKTRKHQESNLNLLSYYHHLMFTIL